jgi:hypothetical protein
MPEQLFAIADEASNSDAFLLPRVRPLFGASRRFDARHY